MLEFYKTLDNETKKGYGVLIEHMLQYTRSS